ncbi:MAG: tryptophan synthase subunit alpha [Acidobacteria bacterium]|jgi:tryptophan synthase alpha chain|nr:MAG: tryptophan synthase subunit alpha [Acidobacteriota bacterium]
MRLESFWSKGKKALIPYLMVGYPDYETSYEAFRRVLQSGADVLEIGFPFSDPVADGPTIQMAHEIALKKGIRSKEVFEMSLRLREEFPQVPFLLMTYYNPIFRMGLKNFCERAKDAGIDGFIVPDLPPEEGRELKGACSKFGLSLVFLASPTSGERRLKLICESSDSMVYFVSLTGTTGTRDALPIGQLKKNLELYRSICKKPVVVGFGISKPEQARDVASLSDGVVVGSLLVRLVGERNLEGLEREFSDIKRAVGAIL